MTAPWRNISPVDLAEYPERHATPIAPVLDAASAAAAGWACTPLEERIAALKEAQARIAAGREHLARNITAETGKPITEALAEVNAVIAKFDLAIADAREHLAERAVSDGPHPALVRRIPRGIAVIIGPFNFPLHLGHGAIVAHLLAGNPVIFKPSPAATEAPSYYARLMRDALPPGVFDIVHGGADEAMGLATDPRVRAVCFTGSVAAGRALARALADDFSKELALELGGRNHAIICADADLALAADAVADALCLTCGQRCNATSRVLVHADVAAEFEALLLKSVARWQPGDPEMELGPLINAAAVERYARLIAEPGEWLLPGGVVGEVNGRRGNYVLPAIRRGFVHDDSEPFAPILEIESFTDEDDAARRANATPFGLTASVFTRDRTLFDRLAAVLHAGNIYANLPTTFSPGTLPFGGLGLSGNGRPGGRGFIRFCTEEQAVQWHEWPQATP